MRRIAYGIVLLMFVAGSMFAFGCGGGEEGDDVNLKEPPAEEPAGD